MTPTVGICDVSEVQETPFLVMHGVREWIQTPPPETPWIIPGLLPEGVPSVLAARGGVGKSWLALQACVALATGKPFLGIPLGEPRSSVFLSFEDTEDVMHRRVHQLVSLYRSFGDWTREDTDLVDRNFLCGFVDWKARGATTYLPLLVPRLQGFYEYIQGVGIQPGLLVVDTFARVADGDENAVKDVRPVMTAALQLADITGATPLILHHVGKGQDGIRGNGGKKPTLTDRMAMDWVRGAGAIVDNSRSVIQITVLREDEAESVSLDADTARHGGYAVLGSTKMNGAKRGDWVLIEQTDCGAWVPMRDGVEILARLRGKKALEALTKQTLLVSRVYQAWTRGTRVDRDALVTECCGTAAHPENAFRTLLRKARNAGLIQKPTLDLTPSGFEMAQKYASQYMDTQEDTH